MPQPKKTLSFAVLCAALRTAPSEIPQLTGISGESGTCGTVLDRKKRTARFLELIGTILILAMILAAPNAQAQVPVFTVVYPTGVFPDDVQNVQAAVDKGGTVLLRAVNAAGVPTAFNFGTEVNAAFQGGHVSLNTDVEIFGERSDNYGATINGGRAPFLGLVPVKSKIKGIDFESTFGEVIVIRASTGSEITENTIHNVVPVEAHGGPNGQTFTFNEGIEFSGNAPQDITGMVRVSKNVIDGLGAVISYGIQFETVAARSEISDNIIRNVNTADTAGSIGILMVRGQALAVIAENSIIPGASQTANSAGIVVEGNPDAVYRVRDNEVSVDGPFEDGIDVVGTDRGVIGTVNALINENHVTLHNGEFGIALADSVTDSLIAENQINGDGNAALVVTTIGFDQIASLNRFIDNDIEGFNSSFADVFFDANAQNNLLVGDCKSVIDLGTGNSATCDEDQSGSMANTLTSTAQAPARMLTGAGETALARKKQFIGKLPPIVRAEPIE